MTWRGSEKVLISLDRLRVRAGLECVASLGEHLISRFAEHQEPNCGAREQQKGKGPTAEENERRIPAFFPLRWFAALFSVGNAADRSFLLGCGRRSGRLGGKISFGSSFIRQRAWFLDD